MKKFWKHLKKKWNRTLNCFIEDEEGVGVVEIILILVDKLTTLYTCVLC